MDNYLNATVSDLSRLRAIVPDTQMAVFTLSEKYLQLMSQCFFKRLQHVSCYHL